MPCQVSFCCMEVKALGWQSCVNPIRLAFRVVADMCIAHRRQSTGGVLRGMSGWACAINHDFSVLVGEQPRSEFLNLIGRQVYGSWQMRVFVCRTWERFNQDKVFMAIKPVFKFLTCNRVCSGGHLNLLYDDASLGKFVTSRNQFAYGESSVQRDLCGDEICPG